MNEKQTSLIQSVSQIQPIYDADIEKMFLDCAIECNSGEIYQNIAEIPRPLGRGVRHEPLIKDMAFLFNFIKNRS